MSTTKSTTTTTATATTTTTTTTTTTLTEDGGVIKELLIPGKGQAIETGDILAIEYTAKVKGSDSPFAKGSQEKVSNDLHYSSSLV